MLRVSRLVAPSATVATRLNTRISTQKNVYPFVQVFSKYSSNSFAKQTQASFHTPFHHCGDVSGVIAGVAAVGALVGVAKMWMDATYLDAASPPTPKGSSNISRDDIAQFYADLRLAIEQLFSQLPTLDASLRAHLKNTNVELSEDEYKQAFQQNLFEIIANIEHQVLQETGWDRTELAAAMEMHAEDEEIKQVQSALQAVMHSVFPPPELPEHLTSQKVLELLTVIVSGMEQAMSETLNHARSEGITDPNKAMTEFQDIYIQQVEQLTFQELKKHNISKETFDFAVQKFYSENASFRTQVDRIYEAQAVSFRRLGLDVDDQVE